METASTLEDATAKVYAGPLTCRATQSGQNVILTYSISGYYDSANTVFYFETTTEVYTTITQIWDTWVHFPRYSLALLFPLTDPQHLWIVR